MKSIKNKILSVLLFTFAFFVMHDYIVKGANTNVDYKLCYMEYDENSIDLKLHVHETIHTILALNCEEESAIQHKLSDTKPSILVVGLTSHINLVPQRPPLS